LEASQFRNTRVVLAAAHLDSDPTNNRLKNLRALCQRCHLLQDRQHHWAQRWITYRQRSAIGDFFLGPYLALIAGAVHPLIGLGWERMLLRRSTTPAHRLQHAAKAIEDHLDFLAGQ